MKFAYTILYVQDVAATLAFYEKAFGLSRKFITPEGDYGELQSGEVTLAFADYSLAEDSFPPCPSGAAVQKSDLKKLPFAMEIAFTTEDVPTAFAKAIAAGAVSVSEVKEKPWGQQVAYVRDNNGFLVEICSPINS